MNLFSNLWNLWYQIVAFPVTQAPQFKNGQIATLVTAVVSVGIATGIWWLNRRYPQEKQDHHMDLPAEDVFGESGKEDSIEGDAKEVDQAVVPVARENKP